MKFVMGVLLTASAAFAGKISLKGAGSAVEFKGDDGAADTSLTAEDVLFLKDLKEGQIASIVTDISDLKASNATIFDMAYRAPGHESNPAAHCDKISPSVNGVYWYSLPSGNKKLWTDFETFPPHCFVLVAQAKYNSVDHRRTDAMNTDDLGIVRTDVAISRTAQLSDDDQNALREAGSITWNIGGQTQTFYRNTATRWDSSAGSNTCSVDQDFHDALALPDSNPTWITEGIAYRGCGGIHLASLGWGVLSGIYANIGSYSGAYAAQLIGRTGTATTSPYNQLVGDGSWGEDGMVLFSAKR